MDDWKLSAVTVVRLERDINMLVSMFILSLFISHSVARQCYTVVRATQQVNGKWQFLGCQNSVTPEPIA